MIKFAFLILFSFFLISCFIATADTSLCKSSQITLNIQPPVVGVEVPINQYSLIENFKFRINNVSEYGTLTLANFSYQMLGNVNWVIQSSILIESQSVKINYPPILFARQISSQDNKINFEILLSPEKIQDYLLNNEVKFTFFFEGSPPANSEITNELCFEEQITR